MQKRRHTDAMAAPRRRSGEIGERYLKTVSAVVLWYASTAIIILCSFVPDVAPDNSNFWRVALGAPALAMGTFAWIAGPRMSSRAFQNFIELSMIPALGINLILLQLTPATMGVLFNMLATLIFAGYFARRLALGITLLGGVAIALSSLFTEPASQTEHLGSFLVVYIPTFVLTALLLHIQNTETLDALAVTRHRALTDPLTGLANLRSLEREAKRRLRRDGRRHDDRLTALLLIDLDNFKSANSRHGHVGGDHALRSIARQLKRVAPAHSLVARVGGDEFAVLTYADSRERAIETGEIFRGAVRAASSVMDMPGVEIDAAVGCAVFPDEGRDLSELLDAADKAMYARKGEKRHPVPNLEAVPDDTATQPAWLNGERRSAAPVRPAHRTLDTMTGGDVRLLRTRSLYARTSALAWAVGSVMLGLSMLMPDAYPDPVLPWWFVLFGGLALSCGIFFINAQPETPLHLVFDIFAFAGLAGLIALTGGLSSTVAPLLILLVASEAWFWKTRLVALRIVGPILVALSPLLYDSLGPAPGSSITLVALFAECAMIVTLVLAMYFDRWLLSALQERAEELAMTDPLTGVSNRRAFEAYVQHHLDDPEGDGQFAIVMIDLDNFKQVNTTRGHRAGDRVLRQIAESLQAASREDDCVARVGGDEFAAVLPGVGVDGARTLAERFVNTVAETEAAREAGVGASAGFALHPLHGETLDQLVFTADSALMAVKASGKGSARVARVVSAV